MTTIPNASALAESAAQLPVLQSQLAVLETQRQVVSVQNEIDQLMKEAEYGRQVMEAYGDWVNPQEYLNDDPSFGLGGRYVNPLSRPDDRADGRYRPVFENETDLAMIRGAAHVITTSTGSGLNILGNLTDYTIGSGFKYEAKLADEKGEPQEKLVAAVQRVIDTFLDDNDWQSDLEREVHWRSREDGEAAIVLRPRYQSWRTQVNLIEPDNITEPTNTRDMEDWLARIGNSIGSHVAGDFVSSWSFGVHTRANDTAHPLGFNANFTGGSDWEYYPAEDVRLAMRLGSGVMEFIKCNVPMNVKRGVSDFYPILATLERAEKLSKNVQITAAIQAAIAFIRNHPKTTTQAQVQSLVSNNASGTVQRPAGSGSTRSVSKQNFNPGTIIDTNGTEYMSGPMGQSNAPTFIDVIQSALRAAGSRWRIPEYMISSDASNNNFASILVAGSPFVQARGADQRFYASRFKRMMWKVVRIAYEGGYFQGFGIAWDQLEALIDIVCTPPDITIADELKNAQIKQIEKQEGVLSVKTWRKETGRDPEEEEANIAEEGGVVPASGTGTGAGTSSLADGTNADATTNVAGTALNGAQIASLKGIIQDAAAGVIPVASVKPTIQLSFPTIPAEKIDEIVASLDGFVATSDKNGKPVSPNATSPGQSNDTNSPAAAAGEFGSLSRQQWKRNIKAIDDVLKEVISGSRTDAAASEMLVMLGLDRERAKALITDAKDNGEIDDPDFENTSVQESVFFFESFDPSQARDDNGQWVDEGSISAAIGDATKIAALRAKVTDPEQRAKLDKKLGSTSKPASKSKSVKLSTKERNAVQDYTTDKFKTINKELRDGGSLSGDTKSIVDSIDSALAKSPKHEGTTFRKFTPPDPAAYIEQLQPGKVFSDPAFVSTSKDTPRFIPGGSVALQIIGKNGVDISNISLHGNAEKEVLFPRGTKFKVLKAKQHDQGGWVAIVQEIDGNEIGESLVESFYFPDFYSLPSGMSLLQESAYVAALETATPEERTQLLAKAWEGYP